MRRWRCILGLGVAANLAALFSGHYLPFTDLPQHVAMIATFRHWSDWGFSDVFTLDVARTQYLLYYAAGALLAWPLRSAELANLALLSIIAVALPLSVRALLLALDRDERLTLFSIPLFWNQSLLIGFFNYLAALPVLLFGLASVVRYSKQPTVARGVGLAASSIALFYLHLSALAFFLPAAALFWALLGDGPWRRRIRDAWWIVPVLLLCVHWLVSSPVAHPSEVGWSEPVQVVWQHPLTSWHKFSDALTDIWRNRVDTHCLIAWALLALALLPWGEWRDRARIGVGALVAFSVVLYFAMPYSVGWLAMLNERYAIVGALLLPAALHVPEGVSGRVALGLLSAVGIVSAVSSGVMIRRFQEEVGDFDRVLASAEPRKKLVYLPFDEGSSTAKFMPFHHFGAYYRARIGGIAELSFTELPQSPVRYRPEVEPPRRPWGWEWEPSLRPEDARYYDYVLVRCREPFGEIGPGGWKELSRAGKWALYAKAQR